MCEIDNFCYAVGLSERILELVPRGDAQGRGTELAAIPP